MSVPASGGFSMFGNSDNTTIQGAITQGGGSVASADDFNELIAASTTSFSSPNNLLFHPASNGGTDVTNINQINNALQYRLYPAFFMQLCYHQTNSETACGCDSTDSSDSLSGDYYIAITTTTGVLQSSINITKTDGSVAPTGFYKFGSGDAGGTIVRFWNSTTGVFGNLASSGFGISSVFVPTPNVGGSGDLSGFDQNSTTLPSSWSCANGRVILVSL